MHVCHGLGGVGECYLESMLRSAPCLAGLCEVKALKIAVGASNPGNIFKYVTSGLRGFSVISWPVGESAMTLTP